MGLFSFGGKSQQDADDDQVPVRPRRSARVPEDEPMDPMLPEKKRARRRLIGATALVLAAVIGLPMIFDSEPRPISQDINIQIPPRDKAPAMNASPMPLPPTQATQPEAPPPEAQKPESPKQTAADAASSAPPRSPLAKSVSTVWSTSRQPRPLTLRNPLTRTKAALSCRSQPYRIKRRLTSCCKS
jgi:DedD protein